MSVTPRPAAPETLPDLLGAIVFTIAVAALFRFTADDAFIVMRYALQFARGHGLVFNVGERVSALTSPLHAVILTALTLTSPWPMEMFKVVGAIAALVAVLYAGRQLFTDVWERALFLSATLTSPFVALWSVGGLETPLLLACLTLIVTLAIGIYRRQPSNAELFVFFNLSALAFLCRHDSVVFVAPLAIGVAARHWRRSIPGIAVGGVLAGGWLVFAQHYYGDVLPTSFYLKALGPGHPVLGGLGYELSFAAFCLMPLLLVRRPADYTGPREAWAAVALFLTLAAAVGTVHMMFGFRFYVPVLPALVALYMRATQPMRRIGVWGLAPTLTTNLALWIVVCTFTLNPTLFLPSLFEPHRGFLSRLEKRGLAYEYTRLPAPKYHYLVDALRDTGRAIRADADARGISQSTSLATIIAGATATEIPDIYIYDNLVGVRENCPTLERPEMYRSADYIEVIEPRFGPLERQIGTVASTVVSVSDIPFEFEGRTEHLVVYFNAAATHTPMPARLHDPCPPGR